MNAETLTILISGITAVLGTAGTAVWTLIKYKDAKRKEIEAEQREFYMYIASNIVREAERMFGDSHGAEKKQYAMTRIQNEAIASGIPWIPKLASTSLEQAVALRNDYKNMNVPMSDIIKKETDALKEEALIEQEEAVKELKETVKEGTEIIAGTTKKILIKKNKKEPVVIENNVTTVKED